MDKAVMRQLISKLVICFGIASTTICESNKAKQHFSFHFKEVGNNLDESLVWQEDALHFSFHFKATIFEHENGTFPTSLKHVPSPKAEPPDEYFKQQSSWWTDMFIKQVPHACMKTFTMMKTASLECHLLIDNTNDNELTIWIVTLVSQAWIIIQ